jgi:hypothetical protein
MLSQTSNLFSNVTKRSEEIFDLNQLTDQIEQEKIFQTINAFLNTDGGRLIFNDFKKCPPSVSMACVPELIQNLTYLISQNLPYAINQIKLSFQKIHSESDAYLIILDVDKRQGQFFAYRGEYYLWKNGKVFLTDQMILEQNISNDMTNESNNFSISKKKETRCFHCKKNTDSRKNCKICKRRNNQNAPRVHRKKLRKLNISLDNEAKKEEIKRRANLKCASCFLYKVKAYDCFYCASCYVKKAVKPKTKFALCHTNLKHYAKGLCRLCYRSNQKNTRDKYENKINNNFKNNNVSSLQELTILI